MGAGGIAQILDSPVNLWINQKRLEVSLPSTTAKQT